MIAFTRAELTLLFLMMSLLACAQEKRFFTRSFQTMTSDKTTSERSYTVGDNGTTVEDFDNGVLVHRARISGISGIDSINAFMWYCISQGAELNYRKHLNDAKAMFEAYEKGIIRMRMFISGRSVRFGQVWTEEGTAILNNGTGTYRHFSPETDEDMFETYEDSTLVVRYGIRTEQKDTIYYTFDKMAMPKEGMQQFYAQLSRALQYPGLARLAGKEGQVYVLFVVDENGRLTDFKPLTREGFGFEARVIRKLEALPNWEPAIHKNRPVKMKLVLPVRFKLTG